MLTAADSLVDPFSPKRLRMLQALADAMFAEPADPAARRENDELIASFAQLFFPGLPQKQARNQLAMMVTALLDEAEQRLAERAAGPDAA